MSSIQEIAKKLVIKGKGILAIDESHTTCEKRFKNLGVSFNEKTRQNYRQLLITSPNIEKYLSGIILFDETIRQKTDEGILFTDILKKKGIISGIKVDTGAKDLALHSGEKITEGLDGLRDRLIEYKKLGAEFAKWRAVITINLNKNLPSDSCIYANAHALSRYAGLCQEVGIVPVVEPEILIEGDHDIEISRKISEKTWTILFEELKKMGVDLSATILKTSMIIAGKSSPEQNDIKTVAETTIESFKKVVPKETAGIVFLSGGQSADKSTKHLNEMNKVYKDLPWPVSFSYGRAIQQPALELWAKDRKLNYQKAQEILLKRAKMNSLAVKGEYSESLE